MKIYLKKLILLFFIFSANILVSCSDINQNFQDIIETTEEYIQSSEKITDEYIEDSTEEILNSEKPEILMEKCRNFLNEYEINNKIKYYKIDDIDLDGNNEILIVLDLYENNEISENTDLYDEFEFIKVIVLRDVNGTIELIDELKNSGYENYSADIIQIKDINKKYINVKVTNGGNLDGFILYDLIENEFKVIASSSSYTGTGNDELLDSDNDGKYDGFVQRRWSYDTLYYDVEFYYIWNGKEFIYDNMNIDNMHFEKYPSDIKDVILEYMSLYYLYDGKNEQIYKRLNELSEVDVFNDGYIEISQLYPPIYNSLLEINEEIEFSIDEYEENAYADIRWKDDKENIYVYNLNLKQINGKWKIISSTHL